LLVVRVMVTVLYNHVLPEGENKKWTLDTILIASLQIPEML
jgi:hypothetical protein